MKVSSDKKKADIKADKKMRRDYINQQNPYSYDANKSLKKNINTNRKVARKRKALKQRAYRKVDESYRGVQLCTVKMIIDITLNIVWLKKTIQHIMALKE